MKIRSEREIDLLYRWEILERSSCTDRRPSGSEGWESECNWKDVCLIFLWEPETVPIPSGMTFWTLLFSAPRGP